MFFHRHIALTVLLQALSVCAEPEAEIVPVNPLPPPEMRRQAAAGDAAALFAIADYHLGDDDPAVMLRWLRSSACQGYPLAQVSLGILYDAGDRLYQDRIKACLWFSWAAQQGDPESAGFAADLSLTMEG